MVDNAATQVIEQTKTELPLVAQAALDPALWRAFRLAPNLRSPEVQPRLPVALRWFRSTVEGAPPSRPPPGQG